jgi:hypothetical protein
MAPRQKGLIKTKLKEAFDEVNLQEVHLRPEQVLALVDGFKKSKFIRKINLNNCGLEDWSFRKILQSIDPF